MLPVSLRIYPLVLQTGCDRHEVQPTLPPFLQTRLGHRDLVVGLVALNSDQSTGSGLILSVRFYRALELAYLVLDTSGVYQGIERKNNREMILISP